MGGRISRRRALWLAGGALALPAVGCGVGLAVREDRPKEPEPLGPAQVTGVAHHSITQSFVHVIAHPDDNLYFMNPDLDHALASGAACVTVCLTDGESDGRNVLHTELGRVVRADRPAYTRARINGLTAALALLATGDENSPWDVSLVSYLDGRLVEQHTLRAAPQVQLILLALVEARSVSLPRAASLRGLWLGETEALETLPPVRSGLPAGAAYSREQLIATLHSVLDHYRPTVVRTLDPNPDHSPKPPKDPRSGHVYLDHQDHTYSAYFAQAALARHWAGDRARNATVEHYLGYVNAALPHNLDQAAVGRKVLALNSYGWADNRRCGDPAGCGDRKVGAGALRNGWAQSTRYRAPGSGAWLVPLPDGRLAAFGLLNGAAVQWTQSPRGWDGPRRLAGTGLEGQVQAFRQGDGLIRLLGVRTMLRYAADEHRREIVTAVQTGRDSFGPWESLGAPDGEDPVRSMEFGYPVGLALADGTVQVAARTWGGTVAVRTLSGAGETWTALTLPPHAGGGVQDGLGAVVDGYGNTHVFAPGPRTVVHWASDVPGGPLRPAPPTGLPVPGGPVTAELGEEGALRVRFREPKSARVLTAERAPASEAWRVVAESAPPGGFGRVAVADGAMAVRDDRGRTALRADGRDWQHDGPLLAHTPALAADRDGRLVAVAIGCDGHLYSARQPVPGAPFGAWSQAG
ncbi:PIG-L family deacetylase [Kitasatospora sp. NPDC093679]|uniref:PIG-L family deacetylase n=1 Tax=Kitasatospora sp. NPDC093679 TaxID=3154983 RepID=UPI0034497151